MSAGPIREWFDAHKPVNLSTPDKHRVCFDKSGRGYCGRTSARTRTSDWGEVVCWDCVAAARTDGVLPRGVV